MEASDSPIEQRRAAVAILRAHAPTRRSRPATSPNSAPRPPASAVNAAAPASEPHPGGDEPDIDDASPDLDLDDLSDLPDPPSPADLSGEEPPAYTAEERPHLDLPPDVSPDLPPNLQANPHTGPRSVPCRVPAQPEPLPAPSAASHAYPPILYPDELDEYSVFPPDFIPGRHPLAPKPPPTDTPPTLQSDSS